MATHKREAWAMGLPENIHSLASDVAVPLIAAAAPKVICQFSGGKDSVCCYLRLLDFWKPENIVLVFFHYFPKLRFQEEALTYYERLWGQRIIRLPHPRFYNAIRLHTWQPWHRAQALGEFARDLEPVPKSKGCSFDYNDLLACVKEDLGWPAETPAIVGTRAADSVFRRWNAKRFGAYNTLHNIVLPIFDWTNAQSLERLTTAQVKLAVDYRIMGRSFDGYDYRFLAPLKEHYPDDYERIKAFMPLADAEILRYQIAEARSKQSLYLANPPTAPKASAAPPSAKKALAEARTQTQPTTITGKKQ